jgi:hypothetical protein
MRIIAFITDAPPCATSSPTSASRPPRIAPARGPSLWEKAGAEHEPSLDPALPPTLAYEFDQRRTW